MKLFNRNGLGAEEITAAVGVISNTVSFDKWEPLLPFGIRDVEAIVGREPVVALAEYYNSDAPQEDEDMTAALKYLQQAVAFFTWLKLIPTLDAQHDESGRSRRLGENEKGLTALQEYKDEANILNLAYESVDALIAELDRHAFPFWVESPKFRQRSGLLIRSVEEFDDFYFIGSHRLFLTLLPIIREVQGNDIAPILWKFLAELTETAVEDLNPELSLMRSTSCRALALLTMKKAVERLPVQVIPEGVVQVQQSQPVNSRLRAEQSARAAVAASLGADATRALDLLQQQVANLSADDTKPEDAFVAGPITHSKGMTF